MARASTLLSIAGLLILTAVCAQAESFDFTFYEYAPEANEIRSFGPKNNPENDEVGNGYVYSNDAHKTSSTSSEKYGTVAGMFFYVDPVTLNEVGSITFVDIGEEGGRFANAEIHFRGIWNLKEDGSEYKDQELSVVGGSYGLAGAYGSLFYTKLSDDFWKVVGKFQIDDCSLVPV